MYDWPSTISEIYTVKSTAKKPYNGRYGIKAL